MAVNPPSGNEPPPVPSGGGGAREQRAPTLQVIFDTIEDIVYLIDVLPDGYRFGAVNARFLEATGLTAAQVIGRRVEEVFPEPSLGLALSHYAQAAASGQPMYWEEIARFPAGERYGEVMVAPVFDADGRCVQLVGTVHDVTGRRSTEQKLHRLAHYDALTGLPNRRYATECLERECRAAIEQGHSLALLYLDLDRFKYVNDTQGHSMGDELLRQVAERIQACTRSCDIVGRFGGDEFGVIAPIARHPQDAAALARQLTEAMRHPFLLGEAMAVVTLSIGIAVCPEDACDAEAMMRYADTAMYHAKAAGRNAYRFFTPKMNQWAQERRELEAALRQAVEREQFVLHYQPQVDLRSGRWTGVEALLRWQCPDRGEVEPADFIPVLEQTGQIVAVGRWVIAQACRQLQRWRRAGIEGLSVSVNMSGRQVPPDARRDAEGFPTGLPSWGDSEICEYVERCLRDFQVERGALKLELTETTLMSDAENTIVLLARLKALGLKILVDDFGTGYSSLAYLKRLPIDALKIDQAFVRDLGHDEEDREITRAIIRLAHSLGLRVIAEGVEDRQQLQFLKDEACDLAQGFYFSVPVPADTLAQLYHSSRH
ncbi:putative bifunctional diguanylate cyclase/phosphodiesterase [Cognatiluteimonas weifangensis]|uniref:EAL domain-containing protein n=1 Tax=Cognatiluteimonas weifangensis TaxID=2303539 RepID=A0A372DMS1_9GAMM|nr:EAL domain-containing protein [Luteimonas weifangensis]RFP60885.1 EAL domain-containing protein [Luteimonas weifangensis]